MRISSRLVIGSLVSAVVLVATVSCSKNGKGERTCAKSSVGCSCRNETFPIAAGWAPIGSCDAPKPAVKGTDSGCCFDLDSAGETSWCRCSSAACRKSTRPGSTFCACSMTDGSASDADDYVTVAECTAVSPARCCKSATSCKCQEVLCKKDETEVDRCSPTDAHHDVCRFPGPGYAQSCDGLKWRKPSPAAAKSGG